MNVSVNPVLKTATGSFPALGFGTWQLENGVARAAVRTALETGYRHINTARLYRNEEAVGLLPRSSKPERIRSNFDVFDFELSDQEMERIFSLDCGERIINPSWAPEWD